MHYLFIIGIDMEKNGPSVHLLNDIMAEMRLRGNQITRIQRKYGNDSWNISVETEKDDIIYKCESAEPHTLNNKKRYLAELKYVKTCCSILKNEKFDCVFLQSCNNAGYQVYWIKKYLKCPIVYNVQDIFPMDLLPDNIITKNNPIYIYLDKLQKYAYKKSDKIITISEDMKDTLISLGVSSDKLELIYNWAYSAPYNHEYNQIVKNKYFSNNFFYIVYAGNIGSSQNVELLIQACEYLTSYNDIRILIIGKGGRLDKCKETANLFNLSNIEFYDLAPQYLAQYIYNNANVNIVTLTKGIFKTSLPSKTAACYKAGKPVIYCVEDEAKTIRRLVKENSMIYQCNPDDPKALAEIIINIYKNKNNSFDIKSFEDVLYPQGPKYYADILERCFK